MKKLPDVEKILSLSSKRRGLLLRRLSKVKKSLCSYYQYPKRLKMSKDICSDIKEEFEIHYQHLSDVENFVHYISKVLMGEAAKRK